jgi:N-acylglucosamine 2-epimerase
LYDSDAISRFSDGKLNREVMISMATRAADFMIQHGIRNDGQVFFSLNREGQPYHFERKIFSACFLCVGCGTLSSLINSASFRTTCITLLHSIIALAHNQAPLGRPALAGAPSTSPMNVPMILLNVIDELRIAGIIEDLSEDGMVSYAAEEQWCVNEILKHVVVDRKIILETVMTDGSVISGSYDGRHMNPGHAIEAGWFLLRYAKRTCNEALKQTATEMIDWSFDIGWDKEFGGLFYFLDSEGKSPPYLEWNMKLWWPHCETMVAFAMLMEEDPDNKSRWENFERVALYTLQHFSDADGGGEWFGYLDRAGVPTHRFKGGPYKGCFHVPRALLFVFEIVSKLEPPSGDV